MAKRKRMTGAEALESFFCRSLIVLDPKYTQNLTDNERSKCQEVHSQLELAQKKMSLYQGEDLPHYQSWVRQHFSSELDTIYELTEEVSELEFIIETVEEESLLSTESKRTIYHEVVRARDKLKNIQENLRSKRDRKNSSFDQEIHEEGSFTDSESGQKQSDEDSSDEIGLDDELLTRSAFEVLFGSEEEWSHSPEEYHQAYQEFKRQYSEKNYSFGENAENESKKGQKTQYSRETVLNHSDSNHKELKLKEVYRQLARKLHPDINLDLDFKQKQMWHEVQDAYQNNQVSRLNELLLMCHMSESSSIGTESLSALKDWRRALSVQLNQLRQQMKRAKRQPAWEFKEKKKNQKKMHLLEKSTSQELVLEIDRLNDLLEHYRTIVERWTAPEKGRKKNSKSSRSFSRATRDMYF